MRITDIKRQWNGTLVIGSEKEAEQFAVFGVVNDNRHVAMGCAFCAIRATAMTQDPQTGQMAPKPDDRAAYARLAIKNGAQLIIANHDFDVQALHLDSYTEKKVFVLVVDDAATVFAQLDVMMNPFDAVPTIAVTGTNGKSSTVSIARDMMIGCGINAFSLGTLGINGLQPVTRLYDNLTTPIASAMHQIYRSLKTHHGAEAIVLEASSQGMVEARLSGITVDVAAFTNFTPDHQDYHSLDQTNFEVDQDGAMDRYFDAKMSLLLERTRQNGTVIINKAMSRFGDATARIAAQRPDLHVMTFAKDADADVVFRRLDIDGSSQRLSLTFDGQSKDVLLPLMGAFQAENVACALAIGLARNVPFAQCIAALHNVGQIPGRMQRVGTTPTGGHVFVDYAHSPDAIRNVILSARSINLSTKLSIVFGCGGERDPLKRPLMAREALKADAVYVTDDNPRQEDPAAIRAEILAAYLGGELSKVTVVSDRFDAIRCAIEELPPEGNLLICGKGHEDYQEVRAADPKLGKHRIAFSDVDVARHILDEMEGANTDICESGKRLSA